MDFYLSAVLLGLCFGAMAVGIFISLKIFNLPDITTDGSFTLGGAVTASLLFQGYTWWIALPLVLLAGALAGAITGIIHTKLKVNALLSGILTMTALYSVNLKIMGQTNIPLIDIKNIFTAIKITENETLNSMLLMILLAVIIIACMHYLLRTDYGLAMQATGNNEQMIRTLGTNTDHTKIAGLAIANMFTALSGFLVTQLQGFADINMGIGVVILGLGAVITGEFFLKIFRRAGFLAQLISVFAGCILLRLILAIALMADIDPVYLKLILALMVLTVISIPKLKKA